MLIREIHIDDAENFINLIKDVEAEADFMLMGAGERKTTPEQQRKQLERMEHQSNSTIFVAEEEGKLVGYLIAIGGSARRTQHSAYLVIGILENFRGKGIGTALFQNLEKWAMNHNISRLELTTVTQNEAGVALYKKIGFEIEGTKRNSLIIDGKPYDEYFMAKLL
ncbi:GNAT family N-acetyltransferase [Cytobacillus depressus]|uniref:GNAT family N-acetyltransferase n=1 Tax=Cytobacillus depressus TaxID=1602942 RepID=A0A6L3V5J8_9BACI|nr:GNAT family N-acetyltransferase [Cytobacillus depressus]KAB2334513.1 GNAT family N-acetyltransferase [Cytobacillus depressus]